MAAIRAHRILVDARNGAGVGIVHAAAVCAQTVVSPSVARRGGETRSGVDTYADGSLALGAARPEPGHRCRRSRRQPRISAVCPMMVCRLRVAMNESVIQHVDRREPAS